MMIRNLGFSMMAILMGSISLHAESIAIVGGTVIDGNGGKPISEGVIVINEGRITAVGDGATAIPAGARRIQANGKYIIPGLIDANVHLVAEPVLMIDAAARYEGRFEDLVAEAAQVALRNGVTTVFDSWGPRQPLVNVRNDINAGKIPGSRIYLAGNIVGYGGIFSADFKSDFKEHATKAFVNRINNMWEQGVGRELLWMTPEQVREKIRTYVKKDIDFLKYGASGHADGDSGYVTFSPEVQKVIVEETHQAGLTVQTHTTTVESLRLAIEAGVDLLQHCDYTGPVPIPDSTIRLMIERDISCAPLSETEKGMAAATELSEPGSEYGADTIRVKDINVRNMVKAGVTLLLSTDAFVVSCDITDTIEWANYEDRLTEMGEGHFLWLEAMAEKGMKPMDGLLAATRNIARAYKVDKDLGTLEKGKIADLLILDENPLENVGNYRRIHLIMKEGQTIDPKGLPTNPVTGER